MNCSLCRPGQLCPRGGHTDSLGRSGQDGEDTTLADLASVTESLRQRKLPQWGVRPRGQNQDPWPGKEHGTRSEDQGFQPSMRFEQVTSSLWKQFRHL